MAAKGSLQKPGSLPVYEGHEQARLRTWVQLARTFFLIQRRILSLLAEHDLTLPQFDVLATLRYSQGANQQELADRLLCTKGNVCGVIDRLEARRWVRRRSDKTDRRANRLYLTPAGSRKIDRVLPEHDALVVRALAELSTADIALLRGMLEHLTRANDAIASGV